jgi:hypothetical protein
MMLELGNILVGGAVMALRRMSPMADRPTLRPMREFDPAKPGVLHDQQSDSMLAWTGEREGDFRRLAKWRADGLVEWDGGLLDGWVEALGG